VQSSDYLSHLFILYYEFFAHFLITRKTLQYKIRPTEPFPSIAPWLPNFSELLTSYPHATIPSTPSSISGNLATLAPSKMHVLSWASWLFVVCVGSAGAATSNSSGVVEVDLVFPRNDTYAPTPYMPIIFGIQNTEFPPLQNLGIEIHIWNKTNGTIIDEGSFGDFYSSRDWANMSDTDPFLIYHHYDKLNTEGIWRLVWTLSWTDCIDAHSKKTLSRSQSSAITFSTKKSAQDIDLVTATKDNNCSQDQGIAFNITNTHEAPAGDESCTTVANSTVIPNPCRVKIDSAAASSISASLTEDLCSRLDPPISCPSDESAAQRMPVGSVACLMAAFGMLGYILM
jgi:hypothetical protein